MAAEKKLCSQMLAATEIARSRGLINGEQLTCPFVQNCLNEVCYYADMVPEDGQMMAENDSDYFDMVGRFFYKANSRRTEKWPVE